MRALSALALLIVLTGCSGDPRSYGITGPGTAPAPVIASPAETPDAAPMPGVSTTGSSYGPNSRPNTGTSGFWGYN